MICNPKLLFFTGWLLAYSALPFALAKDAATITGVVRDSSREVIPGAHVSLLTVQRTQIAITYTDVRGAFSIQGLQAGSYLLVVTLPGFGENRKALNIRPGSNTVEVILEHGTVRETVTVTASAGLVEKLESVPQQVNVVEEEEIVLRAKEVTAQVAEEEAGVNLQRTSPTVAGIFVRGLTGNKVNVFVDGVRFSTSAARGGINSFLNLVDPSDLQSVEILRGTNSAQYGSDALGGSVQFLTRNASLFSQDQTTESRWSTFFNSADAGFGSQFQTSVKTRNLTFLANAAARRINTLRPGEELDSHNAVTRFLGVGSDLVIDGRLAGTAFTQYGGMLKIGWAPSEASQITTNYIRTQQDGGKRYDQLLGGDGNLIAELNNFMLDLLYLRYENAGVGWFDHLTATYSFNSQREVRVNQGGNGNPNASINQEYERTNVNGFQTQLAKQLGPSQDLLLGAEYYHERIDSPSFGFDPVTETTAARRPRVPDNARYQSWAIYAQDVFEAIPEKLRITGNLRYSGASYEAKAEDAPLSANGTPLWPDDSLRVDDITFRAGAVYTLAEGLNVLANFSRGFRAPHMTDLGTLGLTGSGFEVAAPDVAGLGAQVGSTAGRDAVSTGIAVEQVRPETSFTYEAGLKYRSSQVETEFAFFVNDISDNITKQALILPQGAVGLSLGDQEIVAQNPNGVVFVEASPNPVLVRVNFDDARLFGFEHELEWQIADAWSMDTTFSYVYARDKKTGLPPNIEGGTPAPGGNLKIRYAPPGRNFWIEPYAKAAARQERLSSLDLEDRRTGATRSVSSITSFFRNGATARGLVNPGPDGVFGTADDFLIATGETLDQILLRVLGPTLQPSPLFDAVAGYVTFNIRIGLKFGARHEVLIDFENIADKNYRGISWGMDAPGRGIYVKYATRF